MRAGHQEPARFALSPGCHDHPKRHGTSLRPDTLELKMQNRRLLFHSVLKLSKGTDRPFETPRVSRSPSGGRPG